MMSANGGLVNVIIPHTKIARLDLIMVSAKEMPKKMMGTSQDIIENQRFLFHKDPNSQDTQVV